MGKLFDDSWNAVNIVSDRVVHAITHQVDGRMDVKLDQVYGVISGDVVGSTKLDKFKREALFHTMREGSDLLKDWLGRKTMPLDVDIYGGDSWQVLLTNPGKSLAAGLLYRAHLRASNPKCDTRFVVAIGAIDFVPGKSVSEGDGEAFRLSGQLLADGLRRRRMAFAAHDREAANRWDLAFDLIDSLASHHWSEKQALAMTGALRGWKQEEIGTLWNPPIEQPTVNRRLKLAGWSSISRAIAEFEQFWAAYDRK